MQSNNLLSRQQLSHASNCGGMYRDARRSTLVSRIWKPFIARSSWRCCHRTQGLDVYLQLYPS